MDKTTSISCRNHLVQPILSDSYRDHNETSVEPVVDSWEGYQTGTILQDFIKVRVHLACCPVLPPGHDYVRSCNQIVKERQ